MSLLFALLAFLLGLGAGALFALVCVVAGRVRATAPTSGVEA